ncbi:uncharacterized protein PFL1_00073 [Pseudozyma flocculosa PF-1]|nr:uncharacterized protein PFL1_00073 [Pseudozyma flocculosa PF-1]EPQ31874.1 hypothetical protein PFL1_00073 [Pseudozyma flocculosa PF-1]
MVLADFGADVIRIDKTNATLNPDSLCRGKRSIAVSPKDPDGLDLLKQLIATADVVIDPFRPGVLERLGLGPQDLEKDIQRGLVLARLTGFQRVGPYANMAGHDINYIALSGVLSMLGKAGDAPEPPSNILGDFAGGSMICLLGILFALIERSRSGRGQVVEADMVTGARYASTFLLLTSYLSHPQYGAMLNDGTDATRGRNILDGGAPWYGVYKCQDGGWMSVGAIEPHFYKVFLDVLKKALPSAPAGTQHPSVKTQFDRNEWPQMQRYFAACFAQLPRKDWERFFLRTDACVAPVLSRDEAALDGVIPGANPDNVESGNPVVPGVAPKLSRTPGRNPSGSAGGEWEDQGAEMLLTPGEHTDDILAELGIGGGDRRIELYRRGAVDGPDKPEGLIRSKM